MTNEKFCILIEISWKFVSEGPVDKKLTLFFDNGLLPSKQQTIIQTNDDLIYWSINASLSVDGLGTFLILYMSQSYLFVWLYAIILISTIYFYMIIFYYPNHQLSTWK